VTCEAPEMCTKQCVAGCFCKEGTVLDTKLDVCVDPKKCGICEGEGGFCGGIDNVPCPVGATCIDTFTDDCIKGLPSCRGSCKCEYPLASFLQRTDKVTKDQSAALEPIGEAAQAAQAAPAQ
jgi:hypothetical protein